MDGATSGFVTLRRERSKPRGMATRDTRPPQDDAVVTVSRENLGELALDALRFFLDVVVIDGDNLEALEIGRARRRGDVGAQRIAAVGRENLLRVVADHEFCEQLRRVRMRRALH